MVVSIGHFFLSFCHLIKLYQSAICSRFSVLTYYPEWYSVSHGLSPLSFRSTRFVMSNSFSTCTEAVGDNCPARFRKQDKSILYQRLCPPFTSEYTYSTFCVHENMSSDNIDYLINATRITRTFILDTESDHLSNTPAVIQIMCISTDLPVAPVLLLKPIFFNNFFNIVLASSTNI